MNLTWDDFNAKNKNKRVAFENLCRTLFFRELKKTGYDYSYNYNHAGLETAPVYNEKDGKWYGFQCKYFDSTNTSTKNYDEILKSVDIALKQYKSKKQLDCIYIYTNGNFKENLSKKEVEGLKAKKKFSSKEALYKLSLKTPGLIKWVKSDHVLDILKKRDNFDLLKWYFDKGDYLNFLDDLVTIEEKTYINSDEYLDLKLNEEEHLENILESLNDNNISIVLGTAGTGKSLLLKKIYINYVENFC